MTILRNLCFLRQSWPSKNVDDCIPVSFLFRFYFRVSDLRFKGFFWFFNMSHSGQRRQAVHPGFSGSPITQFIAESAYVCRNTRGLQIQAVTAVAENMQIKTDNVLLRRLPRGIISAFFFLTRDLYPIVARWHQRYRTHSQCNSATYPRHIIIACCNIFLQQYPHTQFSDLLS